VVAAAVVGIPAVHLERAAQVVVETEVLMQMPVMEP